MNGRPLGCEQARPAGCGFPVNGSLVGGVPFEPPSVGESSTSGRANVIIGVLAHISSGAFAAIYELQEIETAR
jgi:hypothetical protein